MKREGWIFFGLIAITLTAFCGVGRCQFVNYDDYPYVVYNPHIARGLTMTNFIWAWTTTDGGPHKQGLYIPLTSLSMMVDASLFGAGPQGFHWMNLAWHIANVLLVYFVFRNATGAVWRSALVAALFGVHPLRVESVAWVVERKDALSGFFCLVTMLAYLRFVRSLKWEWYVATVLLFAATLLSKPAMVTLPFVLLLMDYWPLKRWGGPVTVAPLTPSTNTLDADPHLLEYRARKLDASELAVTAVKCPRRTLSQLIVEKVPLLALAATTALVAMRSDTVQLQTMSLGQRLANVPISYARYLIHMVWFPKLAPLYPPHTWSATQVALSCLLLATVTLVCAWKLRSWPWLIVGWLWFLGVLIPMIGLVQFSPLAIMADRFTYFSGIGILLMVVWSIPETAGKPVSITMACIVLIVLIRFTYIQTEYWRDSIALFGHDIAAQGSSAEAEFILGKALRDRGRPGDWPDAIRHLRMALNLDSSKADAHGDLALALAFNQQYSEALPLSVKAISIEPFNPDWHTVQAYILLQSGRFEVARDEADKALALNRRSAFAHRLRGMALGGLGKPEEGIKELKLALAIKPDLKDGKLDLQRLQQQAAEKNR